MERYFGRDVGAVQFAAMCNVILWAKHGSACSSLPSLTERVNVKDKGIDAAWVEVSATGSFSGLLSAGWNVYQYKQRDVFSADRNKLFKGLKREMRGAISKLHSDTGKRPSRYVCFTNLDLSHDQKADLKTSILNGYDEPATVAVEVVGAAELAPYLNDLPHLRSAFFSTSRFRTWLDA
jgi:hypothetical protein